MRRALWIIPLAASALGQLRDPRDIRAGRAIPTESYADQPYIVKTDDGAWLMCVTTGAGREGDPGQHIVTMRSTDQGRTWSKPVDVEPPSLPEASWAVMLKTPPDRIYIFYIHNTGNMRKVIADDPPYKGGYGTRVDSLGYFVFKYSDDHGQTWSAKRYTIPVREFEIDRRNAYGGKVRFFWNVGRPFAHNGSGYVPLHKVGGFGEGFFTSTEGVLLRSANLLAERDPEKIAWETLPDGDLGIRTPPGGGPIAEEHSFSVLSDGSFFTVFRTIDGHPAFSYSRNGGRTWDAAQYMRYADGRLIKHPRAANFAWRCQNGKYLYWFHNHGGRFILEHPQRRTMAYEDRNPVWLAGGEEADSPEGRIIRWSQPEIALYDDDPMVRMSYPDLIEDQGKYFLTETQKEIARVHEIDPVLLAGLWNQSTNKTAAAHGLLLDLPFRGQTMPDSGDAPGLPMLVRRRPGGHGTEDLRGGFSIDLWVQFRSLRAGQVILDNRTPDGRGFALRTSPGGTVEILLNDGRTDNAWESQPGLLEAGQLHHIAVIVDGGPRIMTFVIDGKLCDGGDHRQFGWGRFSPNLRSANGGRLLRIGEGFDGEVRRLRIYGRYLRTSEAIANFRAGPTP
ncbi:MAG: exo-alpha-sialidase [Acidobacteria bacterium]|nr:exo-alpha-sialidase [Acidobacteriota bacterium]